MPNSSTNHVYILLVREWEVVDLIETNSWLYWTDQHTLITDESLQIPHRGSLPVVRWSYIYNPCGLNTIQTTFSIKNKQNYWHAKSVKSFAFNRRYFFALAIFCERNSVFTNLWSSPTINRSLVCFGSWTLRVWFISSVEFHIMVLSRTSMLLFTWLFISVNISWRSICWDLICRRVKKSFLDSKKNYFAVSLLWSFLFENLF